MKYQMLLPIAVIPILGTWLHSVHMFGYQQENSRVRTRYLLIEQNLFSILT
jgi:hypothetical protein